MDVGGGEEKGGWISAGVARVKPGGFAIVGHARSCQQRAGRRRRRGERRMDLGGDGDGEA